MTERKDGLLLAISRVKLGQITPAVFEKWYNDVHMADVLNTSEIHSAARADWPFLALYPVPDVAFLASEEFTSVPIAIESDLQGVKTCFDVVEFDIRQHRAVVDVRAGSLADGPANYILLVEFGTDVPEAELGKTVTDWLQGAGSAKDAPRRATVHKLTWSFNHPAEEKLKELPAYLATFEFDGDEDVYRDAIKKIESVGKVRQWKLNKVFP
ncbi:hypothetical protein BDV19DRAFT_395080 [Aspergillus venezuelensis]